MKKIVFVLMLVMLISACDNSANKKKVTTLKDSIDYTKEPDQIAHNITINFVDSVLKISILKAKRARVFTEKQETILDSGIYIEFFSRATGKRISTITADSIKINDRTRDMIALGRVVVIADSSQTRLETKELQWLNDRKKIHTMSNIKIQSPERIIFGSGFESDIDLKNYVIYKVSGEEYR
jgi:LPS export ABC transporter protein LptC